MEGRRTRTDGAATGSFDEAALLAACRRGEGAAFETLVRLHQDRVFNAALRVCGNRADAEDVTQEAFVRALGALDRFDGRSGLYTWLFRIAVNLAISNRRRATRAATVSLAGARRHDGEGGDGLDRLAATGPVPMDRACDDERDEVVQHALSELEDEARAIIVLRDVEDLSYEEIASILEAPLGTVKSRLHRARLALREKLTAVLGPMT